MKKYLYLLFAAFVATTMVACTEKVGSEPGNDPTAVATIYQLAAPKECDPDTTCKLRICPNSTSRKMWVLAELEADKEAYVSSKGEAAYAKYVSENGTSYEAADQDILLENLAGKYVITAVVADAGNNLKAYEYKYEGILWQDFCTATLYSGHLEAFLGNQFPTPVKLQKADGRNEYRFVAPYYAAASRYGFTQYAQDGYNLRFEWDGQSESIKPISDRVIDGLYVLANGFVHPNYGMTYWFVDSDPNYTFYDAENKMFQIETKLSIFQGSSPGAFGWYDDWYILDL
jgi:hypothetical protein